MEDMLLTCPAVHDFAEEFDGVEPYISLGIKGVEFNAPTTCILFSVHQQQTESSGGMGSSFQNREPYRADSQWGASSLTTVQDQEESDHQLISAEDDYGNSETTVARTAVDQQAFSYWNVSASLTEVREV
jgi:hypothetical protein